MTIQEAQKAALSQHIQQLDDYKINLLIDALRKLAMEDMGTPNNQAIAEKIANIIL